MMRRSGFMSQLRPTANARSWLVYVFHRAEKKLRHWMPSRSASHRPLYSVYNPSLCAGS